MGYERKGVLSGKDPGICGMQRAEAEAEKGMVLTARKALQEGSELPAGAGWTRASWRQESRVGQRSGSLAGVARGRKLA